VTAAFVPLPADAMPAVAALAARCLAVDGGLPQSAELAFVTRRYAAEGGLAIGAYGPGDELVAAAAVRPTGATVTGTALVDPAARGRGLGAAALDWALGAADVIDTESLTERAAALFASRGLSQSFAEEVLRRDLTELPGEPTEAPLPAAVELLTWAANTISRFYELYRTSFADRPGFPGWSQQQWVDWLVDDDFRPDCSLLATGGGTDFGFVVCAEGWLVQLGTVPAARGRGIGAALTVAALTRMRAAGATEVLLDVNVNNANAAALYRRLGFTTVGRRARYDRG
jgi:mycothiol synthase